MGEAFHSKAVSQQKGSKNIGEVCIPPATSKGSLLTIVSELISAYKDQISVIASGSLALLIAWRCLFIGNDKLRRI